MGFSGYFTSLYHPHLLAARDLSPVDLGEIGGGRGQGEEEGDYRN
jgi:hypothetical protein